MENHAPKFIDVEAVLKEKNPRLYKVLPRFIIRWIKKKLHEDFINEGIEVHKNAFHLDFNDAAMSWLKLQVDWKNGQHIPATGGVIFASNHPLGGLDGMALIKAIASKRSDIRFLVNDILTKLSNFQSLFVAVNKVGTNSKEAIKIIDGVYGSDNAVLVFPAGLVSRKQKGKIEDLEWKKSFIANAVKYKKPVVPVFIDGKNSSFFYNFALWRKRLGIKANIEMFFLADEMVKLMNKKITVIFSQPVPPEVFDKSRTHLEWAQLMKKFVYNIKSEPELSFGDYLKRLSS
jgi:1-acyl-sn-glycerol-3-phosphate acyltransferase